MGTMALTTLVFALVLCYTTYDLEFSTFLGGSGQDQIRDVGTDSQGNIYLVGGMDSPNFPTTPDRESNEAYLAGWVAAIVRK